MVLAGDDDTPRVHALNRLIDATMPSMEQASGGPDEWQLMPLNKSQTKARLSPVVMEHGKNNGATAAGSPGPLEITIPLGTQAENFVRRCPRRYARHRTRLEPMAYRQYRLRPCQSTPPVFRMQNNETHHPPQAPVYTSKGRRTVRDTKSRPVCEVEYHAPHQEDQKID